jgi:RNA polymerase sigma-70 factor (ECF subfamily)
MISSLTNRQLFESLSQQDSEQQRRAFELLFRELYAICLFMLQNAQVSEPYELAKDCTQEAIVKVWKNLPTCQQPDSFRSWARTIIRNQTLNEITRIKRHHEETIESDEAQLVEDHANTPQVALDKAEKYGALLDLLAASPISFRSRYVIIGKYLMQMTEDEICTALQEREGGLIKPSHVQVTRAKNFKKIYGDADLLSRFWELYQTTTT